MSVVDFGAERRKRGIGRRVMSASLLRCIDADGVESNGSVELVVHAAHGSKVSVDEVKELCAYVRQCADRWEMEIEKGWRK